MSLRPIRPLRSAALLTLATLGALPAAGQNAKPPARQTEAVEQVGPAIAAQMQLAQPPAADPAAADDGLTGSDPNEGVFVRDSALAVEKLAHAQRMERQKEWDNAASLYQEVLEKYPDRVVPSKKDKDGKIYQYTSVAHRVREALAKWQAEGRQVYRGRYEAVAAALMDSAGPDDVNTLNRVLSLYFITEAGKQAALRLVEVYLERGEYVAAARTADELLQLYPKEDLGDERPGLLFRAGLAYQLAGESERAQQRLATLRDEHAEAKGVVRGQEVALAQSLEAELKANAEAAAKLAVVASPDAYVMPGGGPSRGHVSAASGKPGALLFSLPLPRPDGPNVPPQYRTAPEQAGQDASAAYLGIIPATDRGELFFHDNQSLFAVSLESGVPLPGWLQTYGTDRGGRYTVPGAAAPSRTSQNTLTLTEDAVFAVMGQADRLAAVMGAVNVRDLNGLRVAGGQGEPKLVSLDRRIGKENWTAALSQLPPDAAELRNLWMGGSPLVVGDNVLVAARGVKQQQFEDCWVLCFDRGSGKFRWSCYIASSHNMMGMSGVGSVAGDPVHLAYADGRVYVLSDLGAVAAVDAYAGTIVWLNIYPTERSMMMGAGGRFDPFIRRRAGFVTRAATGSAKPWLFNPPIVHEGKVFVLPDEGKHLFVYDAGTGAEVKRVEKAHLNNAQVLLGVLGNRLIAVGDERVVCLDWRKYDPEKFQPDTDASILWASAEFGAIQGRAFLTADSLYVPTRDRLWRLSVQNGLALEAYPPHEGTSPRTWGDGEGPGNVVVASDHVVIAGAADVDVYTDLGAARRKLDAEVAAAPTDPGPRLRYAEVMFVSGQTDLALAKLDEAIGLLGGPKAMQAGPNRDRVFSDALTFAQKLAADERPAAQALAGPMYERAAAAARSPQQQVEYRLSRAEYAREQRDATTAVRLYQEILSDPALRPEPRLDETTGELTQAHAVAERAIAALIERAGRDVYAPFEQQAADALKQAQAAAKPDPAALLALAQTYPLAQVAPQALHAAADAFEAAGNPKQSIQALRQLYFKYPEYGDKALVLESMARNYLALPNRAEVAAARLAQGASLPGGEGAKLRKPLRLPDGRELPAGTEFASALREIRKYRSQEAAKSLPDFGVPVPPSAEQLAALQKAGKEAPGPFAPKRAEDVIANVAALAEPLREFARPDRVVAWSSDGTLSIYATGNHQPLGTSNALAEPPQGSAWAGGSDVLVWGPTQLVLVPEKGGPAKWRLSLKDLPALEVAKAAAGAADAAAQQQAQAGNNNQGVFVGGDRVVIQGGRQVIVRGGRVVAGGPALPVQQPVQRPVPGAAEQVADVRPLGDRFLVTTSTGRLLCASLEDGKIAWQTRLTDRAFDRLVANEEFAVARVTDDTSVRLVALDSFTGQVRGTKAFSPQVNLAPQNLALSADGTLVYTMPDRLVLKDLYKPWAEAERQVTAQPGQMPFLGATAPDQIVIAEGRILALADDGNEKFVRVHSLETGQPQTVTTEAGQAVERRLGAGTKAWSVSLRVVGPRLYVFNGNTVRAYNLERADELWEGWYDPEQPPLVREAFVGQTFVVLVDQSQLPDDNRVTTRLLMFGRYPGTPGDTRESGRLDYRVAVDEAAEVTAWQAVEGGFYYLAADGKLHLLRGASPE